MSKPIPKHEQEIYEAVMLERGMWEEVIFRQGDRCGIDRKGLSAGQVLTAIADKLLESRVWGWLF